MDHQTKGWEGRVEPKDINSLTDKLAQLSSDELHRVLTGVVEARSVGGAPSMEPQQQQQPPAVSKSSFICPSDVPVSHPQTPTPGNSISTMDSKGSSLSPEHILKDIVGVSTNNSDLSLLETNRRGLNWGSLLNHDLNLNREGAPSGPPPLAGHTTRIPSVDNNPNVNDNIEQLFNLFSSESPKPEGKEDVLGAVEGPSVQSIQRECDDLTLGQVGMGYSLDGPDRPMTEEVAELSKMVVLSGIDLLVDPSSLRDAVGFLGGYRQMEVLWPDQGVVGHDAGPKKYCIAIQFQDAQSAVAGAEILQVLQEDETMTNSVPRFNVVYTGKPNQGDKQHFSHRGKRLCQIPAGRQAPHLPDERKLFVCNIPKSANRWALAKLFEPYGPLLEIFLFRRCNSAGSRRAFVRCASSAQAERAIRDLNDREYNKKILEVRYAL